MALGTPSNCINHPSVEAVGRCKQCGKPFCSACAISGPTGKFCSDSCKEKHQAFIQRAQQLERSSVGAGFLLKVRRMVVKVAIWAAVILVVVFLLAKFNVYDVPILAKLMRQYIGF
jgi:hypothetical protein